MDGRLVLDFDSDGMRVLEQQPPWKVVRAFRGEDGQSLVHLNNLSGGVLGGDQLGLTLRIGAGANVQVTSTGATRLYRARDGMPPSRCIADIHVGAKGMLEYLPDPLIPYADSDFEQCTAIRLDSDATLFWWETVAPGREAMGELFAYRRLSVSANICGPDGPIAMERMRLSSGQDSVVRMGPFRYISTLYVCRPGVVDWRAMEQRLTAIAEELSASDGVRWGVSGLHRHGLVVRGLSVRSNAIANSLLQFWRAAKLLLCDAPAVLPRKT